MSLEKQIAFALDIVDEFDGVFEIFRKRPQNVFCVYCDREMHPRRARSHVNTLDHLENAGDYLSSSSSEESDDDKRSTTSRQAYASNTTKRVVGAGQREALAAISEFPELEQCSWRPMNVYCPYCQKEMAPHNAALHVRGYAHRDAYDGVSSTNKTDASAVKFIASDPVTAPSELEKSAYSLVEQFRRDYGPYFQIEDARAVKAFICTICRQVGAMSSVEALEHGRSWAHKERREVVEKEALRAVELKAKRNAYHLKHSSRDYGGHGDKPDITAMERFAAQLVVDLPFFDLPERYAALVASDFPTRKELSDSRADLMRLCRQDLSSIVPGWDPLTIADDLCDENDNPNQTGCHLLHRFPYPIVCTHLRILYASMLQMEEAAAAIEMRAYNKKGIHFRVHGGGFGRFEVDMPGVSENRPSVLRGDKLHIHVDAARPPGSFPQKGRTFYAYVHFVNLDTIVFSMPRGFVYDPNSTYSIVFKPSRTQERKLHRAVRMTPNTAMLLRETCIGSFEGVGGPKDSVAFRPPIDLSAAVSCISGDADVGSAVGAGAVKTVSMLNDEQQAFIKHVHGLNRLSVLWGPPGTGKTTTLVAAIIDTLLRAPRDSSAIKILVCAPSNEAADLIAERIIANSEVSSMVNGAINGFNKMLIRLPSMSRDPKLMPSSLLPFCPPTEQGVFSFPTAEQICEYKIVVTTLMTCDRLFSVGVKGEHFSHLFVDEAGHATEPLLMIALNTARGGAFGCGTKVVLAGDHKQLGPRITVPTFIEANVHASPLLRIVSDEILWSEVGTQLLRCYRSHPAIVRLINTCYNDTLIATVPDVNRFAGLWFTPFVHRKLWAEHTRLHGLAFKMLEPPKAPILCINHSFPESREEDSPSWMNSFEVDTVCELIFTLWQSKLVNDLNEIAVITPYRKQVQKISDKLLGRMAHDPTMSHLLLWTDPRTFEPLRRPRIPIKVATVDSYQGRESRVVIVSCVRSHMDALRQDARFGLGFLNQPERANVSLSRAKDLLLIVGNREVLCTDPMWASYYGRLDEMGEGVVIDVGGPAHAFRSSEFEEEVVEVDETVETVHDVVFEEKGGVAREE